MSNRNHRDFYPDISAFHHIDGDPTNDSLDNLVLVNTRDHYNPIIEDAGDDSKTCPYCGGVMFDEDGLWICSSCGGDADPDEEEDLE